MPVALAKREIMPFHALHPERNERISVTDYRRYIGSRPIGASLARPRARCPLCGNTLAVRAVNPNRRAHFWHDLDRCVVVQFGRSPYDDLVVNPVHPEQANNLKAAFRAHWRSYYQLLMRLVPKLSVHEFCELLTRAERHSIWHLVNLQLTQVPYVLVMLADFPPWTGMPARGPYAGREYWYRFWFLDGPHDLTQLWMMDPPATGIVRGQFNPPENQDGFPESEDFDFEIFELDNEFLNQQVGPMNPYIEERVEAVLDELRFPRQIR